MVLETNEAKSRHLAGPGQCKQGCYPQNMKPADRWARNDAEEPPGSEVKDAKRRTSTYRCPRALFKGQCSLSIAARPCIMDKATVMGNANYGVGNHWSQIPVYSRYRIMQRPWNQRTADPEGG